MPLVSSLKCMHARAALSLTSELRLLVSLPTIPCFSINTVLTPSRCCSLLAIARPTAPPPMTACVKSACLVAVLEKQRD